MFFDNNLVDVLVDKDKIPLTSPGFKSLCKIGILCNKAIFVPGGSEEDIAARKVLGDASESAVLKCMEILVGDTQTIRLQHPKVSKSRLIYFLIYAINKTSETVGVCLLLILNPFDQFV